MANSSPYNISQRPIGKELRCWGIRQPTSHMGGIMKNSFTTLAQVIISILIVYTIGCGGSQEDDSETFIDETHVPEKTISANPPTGSTIEPKR